MKPRCSKRPGVSQGVDLPTDREAGNHLGISCTALSPGSDGGLPPSSQLSNAHEGRRGADPPSPQQRGQLDRSRESPSVEAGAVHPLLSGASRLVGRSFSLGISSSSHRSSRLRARRPALQPSVVFAGRVAAAWLNVTRSVTGTVPITLRLMHLPRRILYLPQLCVSASLRETHHPFVIRHSAFGIPSPRPPLHPAGRPCLVPDVFSGAGNSDRVQGVGPGV